MTPGKFLTLEGIDGAGKSSHLEFIADWVRGRGLERAMLFVDGANTSALSLYRRLDFTVTTTTTASVSSVIRAGGPPIQPVLTGMEPETWSRYV